MLKPINPEDIAFFPPTTLTKSFSSKAVFLTIFFSMIIQFLSLLSSNISDNLNISCSLIHTQKDTNLTSFLTDLVS